jgi:hypothetical protein
MLAMNIPMSSPSGLRRVLRNRSAALAALTAASVVMLSLFTPGSARADTFYMCGHEIRTLLVRLCPRALHSAFATGLSRACAACEWIAECE